MDPKRRTKAFGALEGTLHSRNSEFRSEHFLWQMLFLKHTVSSNKYLTKIHFVLLGDVN
jgi:hypothetical protein